MIRAIYKYVSLVCIFVVLVNGSVTERIMVSQSDCSQVCRKVSKVSIKRVTIVYGLSEGPHWDNCTQKLYFVDIYNQYIRRLDPETGVVTSAYIANGTVSVIIPVYDTVDKFVVGLGKDVVLVTWNGDSDESEVPVKRLVSLDSPKAETRTNDGKVDSSGRFWIGTMGDINGQIPPNQGTLYRVGKDLTAQVEISPVSISNGLAWNSKDDTFYYIDSSTRQIVAYDFHPSYGIISNKRIVFDLNQTDLAGILDGMTIDTKDNLWVALFDGHHVIHVNPKTGKILRKIKMPAENVSNVMFGGPHLDILYVTTSGYNLTAAQREETPHAGAVFAVKGLGVRGRVANSFVMKLKKHY